MARARQMRTANTTIATTEKHEAKSSIGEIFHQNIN